MDKEKEKKQIEISWLRVTGLFCSIAFLIAIIYAYTNNNPSEISFDIIGLFWLPTLIYIIVYIGNLIHRDFSVRYLIFRNIREKKVTAEPVNKEINEIELKKEAIKKEEMGRKEKEKYEIKKISSWMCWGPGIGFVIALIVGLIMLISQESTDKLWWLMGICMLPLILWGFTDDIDKKWEITLSVKREIEDQNSKKEINSGNSFSDFNLYNETILNGFKYLEDYIYTDSLLSYWYYTFVKFILGLSTVLFIILSAVLLFIWIGSISIAPTTIIIILLVVIIINQNNNK